MMRNLLTYLRFWRAEPKLLARATAMQAVLIASNILFPVVFASLFSVLADVSSSPLYDFVREQVSTEQLTTAIAGLHLLGLFAIDIGRNYILFNMQAVLDAHGSAIYRSMIKSALVNYLERDYLTRSKEAAPVLQGLTVRLLYAVLGLQAG